MTTVSDDLHQFIERVVAARLDIVVTYGDVSIGSSGGSGATSADFDRFNAELTDSLKAKITQDLLGEGDWEWHELFDFLSDIKMEKLKAQMHSIRCGSEHELADSRAFINNPRRVLDRCEWALAPYQEVNARWHRQHPEPEILSEDGIPL